MVETRKYSEFVPDDVDRPVGLTDGKNTIGPEGSGGGTAPADASYITRTSEPGLDNETALDTLGGEGILKTSADGTPYVTNIQGDGINIVVTGGSGIGDPYIVTFVGSGGGGSDVLITRNNSFAGGEWVRVRASDGLYVNGLANTDENAEIIGMVSEAVSATQFRLKQSGYVPSFTAINAGIPYLPLTVGGVYFLSVSSSGEITLVEASDVDSVSRACLVADGVDSGWILPYRGVVNSADAGSGGGTIPDNPNVITFTQNNHNFNVGEWLRVSASNTFATAQANTFENSQAVGKVIEVIDINTFVLQTEGYDDTESGRTAATLYYLDPANSGQMTSTRPTGLNEFIKPVYVALNSGAGFILEQQQLPLSQLPNSSLHNQPGHMFDLGDAVRVLNTTQYTEAQANNLANSRAVGLITWLDTDNFIVQQSGIVENFAPAWLNADATQFYLSESNPGKLTSVEPTASGEVSKPMFQSIDQTSGWILEQRPMLQPNANGGAGGGGSGNVVQTLYTKTTASQSTILSFPSNPPLITEGIEIFSNTINITALNNIILVDISAQLTQSNVGDRAILAFFRSDNPNAFAAINFTTPQGVRFVANGMASFVADVTGNLTISVRMAEGLGGAGRILTINTTSGTGLNLRGPIASHMIIQEIEP